MSGSLLLSLFIIVPHHFLTVAISSSDRFGDHKRDRFDLYGRMPSGYHRERDRDRDRGMHMNDKRK